MKKKARLRYRINHFFTYHPWLKLISLVLAVMLWFYARTEISRFNY